MQGLESRAQYLQRGMVKWGFRGQRGEGSHLGLGSGVVVDGVCVGSKGSGVCSKYWINAWRSAISGARKRLGMGISHWLATAVRAGRDLFEVRMYWSR